MVLAALQRVATLQGEVATLRCEVGSILKMQGVAALQGEVATLRGEVGSVGEIRERLNLLQEELQRNLQGVAALQGEVATLRAAGLSSDGEIRDLVEERHREVLQKLEEAIAELNKAMATQGVLLNNWCGAQGWDTDEGSVAQGRADSSENCWQRRSGGAQGWGTDGGSAEDGEHGGWSSGHWVLREDCCWQGSSGGAQGWGTNAEGNVDREHGGWSSRHWGGEPASGRRRGGHRSDGQGW